MNSDSFSQETHEQAAAFDHIAEQYEVVFGLNKNHMAAVSWLLERLPPNSHILDIGSGTGVPTARLLFDAGHKVTGIDISSEMVRIAKYNVPTATFLQADAANVTFPPASFYAITAFFSLLMLRRDCIESTLQKLKTMLQPPSYFILSMVEGDFDYKKIPFLSQSLHVSAYPRDVIARQLENLSFTIFDSHAVQFQANEHTPTETQLFFFCQYQNNLHTGSAEFYIEVFSQGGNSGLQSSGVQWSPVESNGVQWSPMESNGVQWSPMESNGVKWSPMESNGVQWSPMESNGVQWSPMESIGVQWSPMESSEVV
ncbi:unnamed protein product [Rotaria socialis]|uniref:Methyltransferase domain-containing protein n=1 Tax=Rotaria socialis TaxID=392032 RepID=A0A820TCQ4_9BILA|nr:unnamed protein product [Rotaria socialis]